MKGYVEVSSTRGIGIMVHENESKSTLQLQEMENTVGGGAICLTYYLILQISLNRMRWAHQLSGAPDTQA